MSTRGVAMIAAISALVGLVVGGLGASWYWLDSNAQFMTSGLVLRTQADIITKVSVLEHIRAGRPEDATKLLETLLDGDLIAAGALARDGRKFNANARRAVALELRAREVSGYQPTDPSVRAAAQEAFRLLAAGVDGSGVQPGAAARAMKPRASELGR
jgi:hypothetical protein